MHIGKVDLDAAVYVVAEIGNNHEGDIELAKELIFEAASAGVDAVKFQTIVPESLVVSSDESRIRQLTQFQLTEEQFSSLHQVAMASGVDFLSTPFDIQAVSFLRHIVPAFKVASGDNLFFPLINEIALTGKPIIISTGLCSEEDINRLCRHLRTVERHSQNVEIDVVLMHCVVSYPTVAREANLAKIRSIGRLTGMTPGYSDHTLGISAAVLSVGLGARVIEKHFTNDKKRASFRDHQLSADPQDMKEMVERIREAELLLGNEEIVVGKSESANKISVRRSIRAARDINIGEVIQLSDLSFLRPGDGLCPSLTRCILGRKSVTCIERDSLINIDQFQER